MKEVSFNKSVFSGCGLNASYNKLKIGDTACPGDRHTPGPKIRYEIVAGDKASGYSVQKIRVGIVDKPIGRYKIVE